MAQKSFEESLKELEEVVAALDGGDLTLDKSVKLYEQGIKLNETCETQLKAAEGKIEELKKLLETRSASTS